MNGLSRNFSVIVPARNAAATIGRCLDSIFKSDCLPDEVIVVDDGSSDGTQAIAARYPCRILTVHIARGPMQPRFAGSRMASQSILVFVDADVCVRAGTFSRLLGHFENPSIDAVTGILSPGGNKKESFFSAFKNEYMNYIFRKQSALAGFLYGSLWAVRRRSMIFFEPVSRPFGSLVSDSEMGMRLRKAGKIIFLDHALEVEHLKKYDFLKLLRNDFVIPFMFSRLLTQSSEKGNSLFRRRFSHVSLGQTLTAMIALAALLGFVTVCLVKSVGIFLMAIAAWLMAEAYWLPFFRKIYSRRGFSFAFKALCFVPLDAAVMGAGMISGLAYAMIVRFPPTECGNDKLVIPECFSRE